MNVVIYARFSSHSQTEQSIEGQLKVCMNMRSQIIIPLSENILTGPSAAPRTTVPNFSG